MGWPVAQVQKEAKLRVKVKGTFRAGSRVFLRQTKKIAQMAEKTRRDVSRDGAIGTKTHPAFGLRPSGTPPCYRREGMGEGFKPGKIFPQDSRVCSGRKNTPRAVQVAEFFNPA